MQAYLCLRSFLNKNLAFKVLMYCYPMVFIKRGAKTGNLLFIKGLLRNNGLEYKYFKAAMEGGHINVLNYLKKKNPHYVPDIEYSILNDYLASFEWIFNNYEHDYSFVMSSAINYGRLAMVRIICTKYTEFEYKAAAKCLPIYMYFLKNKLICDLTPDQVIETNNLNIFCIHNELFKNMTKNEIITLAIIKNSQHILKYVFSDDYRLNDDALRQSIMNGPESTIFLQKKMPGTFLKLGIKLAAIKMCRAIWRGICNVQYLLPRF